MGKLFSEIKIENYLNGSIENKIKLRIDSLTLPQLNNINSNEYIDDLVTEFSAKVPVLSKDKLTYQIKTIMIPGEHLPAGTAYYPGRKYPIDVACYDLPFIGEYELFKCIPQEYSFSNIQCSVHPKYLSFEYTFLGKLIDNEPGLARVKDLFTGDYSRIEDALIKLQQSLERIIPEIKNRCMAYYTAKREILNKVQKSTDSLNPFN